MREDIFVERNGQKQISLKKVIGEGYTQAWFTNCKARYRLFCGARSTKKSYNIIGCEPIFKILSDSRRNVVIVRQNDTDNRQSTFENIYGRIIDLGLENAFKTSKNPLTIEYIPTGQQIIFRGLNNPTSLNSITFAHGYWTDCYIEEAYDVKSYDDFRKLDGSIRGQLPDDLFFQITLCFNAWDGETWLYEEFFKNRLEDDFEYLDRDDVTYMDYYDPEFIGPYGKGLYLHKSTYKINEFRDKDSWDSAALHMKYKSPEIYKVEFLGMFGSSTGATYPEWDSNLVWPMNRIINRDDRAMPVMEFAEYAIGVDAGLSDGTGKKITVNKDENVEKKVRAASTMTLCAITKDLSKLVILEEYFHSNDASQNATNTDNRDNLGLPAQADAMINYLIKWINYYNDSGTSILKGLINVYVDSADIGFRQVLEMKAKEYGLYNVRFMASTKISIASRVDFDRLLMSYNDLIVSERCPNLIREYKAARHGKKGEIRADGNDHVLTAKEYGSTPLLPSLRRWKTFKQH